MQECEKNSLLFQNLTIHFSKCNLQYFSARNYRPSFRENKPKTLVFNDWIEHFGLVFTNTRVYKFGHRQVKVNEIVPLTVKKFFVRCTNCQPNSQLLFPPLQLVGWARPPSNPSPLLSLWLRLSYSMLTFRGFMKWYEGLHWEHTHW